MKPRTDRPFRVATFVVTGTKTWFSSRDHFGQSYRSGNCTTDRYGFLSSDWSSLLRFLLRLNAITGIASPVISSDWIHLLRSIREPTSFTTATASPPSISFSHRRLHLLHRDSSPSHFRLRLQSLSPPSLCNSGLLHPRRSHLLQLHSASQSSRSIPCSSSRSNRKLSSSLLNHRPPSPNQTNPISLSPCKVPPFCSATGSSASQAPPPSVSPGITEPSPSKIRRRRRDLGFLTREDP